MRSASYLDDEVALLFERLGHVESQRLDDTSAHEERLRDATRELRAEIVRATRSGWQLVVAGIVSSGFGALLGVWA